MDLLKEGKEPVLESCAIVRRRLDEHLVADIHHQSAHPGVKWTLYFARSVDLQVSKETAKSVVKACETCRSIDLAPVRWKKGKLSMKDNWSRLVMDITHHNGDNFLSSTVAPLDLQYGIVERSHRTVKTIAARKNCSILEAVYWHNITPKIMFHLAPCRLMRYRDTMSE